MSLISEEKFCWHGISSYMEFMFHQTKLPVTSLYTYADKADDGSRLVVFEENYALLHSTIADIVDPLMKCFVEEKILSTEEEAQISATTAEKLQQILRKISSCLEAGDTKSFNMMLTIMKEQGGKGTQVLSDLIMNRLKSSTDQLSHICSNDVHVQNDEPKG